MNDQAYSKVNNRMLRQKYCGLVLREETERDLHTVATGAWLGLNWRGMTQASTLRERTEKKKSCSIILSSSKAPYN